MKVSAIWALMILLFITSLGLVYTRHLHRVAYLEMRAIELKRDQISNEWQQLLAEENTRSFHHIVEKRASKQLKMRAPTIDEVTFVQLDVINRTNKVTTQEAGGE